MPYLMPNGKWRAKRMIHGALKTKVFPTKAEAKKWEAEQTLDNWQQSEIEIPTVCLLDFCTAYMKMASERMSEKTIVEKKLAFKHLFKVLNPDQPVDTVTPKDALAVPRKVALHTSGNAANKDRKNLAAAWEWGSDLFALLCLERAFCACLQWHLYPLVIVGVNSSDPVRITDDVSPSVTRIS